MIRFTREAKLMVLGLGLAMLLFLSVDGAAAQPSQPTIQTMSVSLWPEYDRPEVLVMYRIQLSPETQLPAQLTFRLPEYVEQMHAVAEQRGGELANINPATIQLSQEGGETLLSFPVNSLAIQVEYYDAVILTKEGDARRIDYVFLAPGTIEALVVEVQHPTRSSGMLVEPATVGSYVGSDSMEYSQIDVDSLAAGEAVDVTVTYSRDTDELSVSSLPPSQSSESDVSPATPPPAEVTGGIQMLYYIISALGGIVVGWLFCWWVEGSRRAALQEELERARRGRRQTGVGGKGKRQSQAKTVHGGSPEAAFCHRCGTALRDDGSYCHICGARRK